MSRDINPFGLRMHPSLRRYLEESAVATGRSLNSEITYRLQRSIDLQSADQAKRDLAIEELRAAAKEAIRFWELDNRDETENAMLKDAMDDIEVWLRKLDRLEG
jgi:Arc-like DNA binding domain.